MVPSLSQSFVPHVVRMISGALGLQVVYLVALAMGGSRGKDDLERRTWAVKWATLVHHAGLGAAALYCLMSEYGDTLWQTALKQTPEAALPLSEQSPKAAPLIPRGAPPKQAPDTKRGQE